MTTVGLHVLHDADVKGHIFDVDGTLIDTMPGFLPSWYTVSAEKGMKMTDELFYCCAGLPLADVVRRVYQANGRDPPTDEDIQDFLQKKRAERERSEAETGPPPGIECVINLAKQARAAGLPIACATSGLRDVVELHMKHAGLTELFDAVVCVGDLPPGCGKPKPDVYLEAARQIGVDPSLCRAYEDGETGFQSAVAAGMHVIDVRDLDGYPLTPGLRFAMKQQRAERTWLSKT
eukprot:m.158029 g.158029  ORF g.158029 m.158029 type:complete len:234 (+) comp14494_c0_seq1:45-746(+)